MNASVVPLCMLMPVKLLHAALCAQDERTSVRCDILLLDNVAADTAMQPSVRKSSMNVPRSLICSGYRLSPQYPFPCAIQDALAACTPALDELPPFTLSRPISHSTTCWRCTSSRSTEHDHCRWRVRWRRADARFAASDSRLRLAYARRRGAHQSMVRRDAFV